MASANKGFVVAVCVAALVSGCVGTRPFEQIEREMNENPVYATFPIPPPCEYVDAPSDTSALLGTWTASGTMNGVDYFARSIQPKRWSATWEKSYTFSADGTYSTADSFNGKPIRATGRWSYADGVLVLDIGGAGKTNTHREYRLHWLDDRTFDLRWLSEAAEADWWKVWVLDRGRHAGWDNSVVVTYDRSGCKRQINRMRKGRTGAIYVTISSPLRYRRSGGSDAPSIVREPVSGAGGVRVVPNATPSQPASSESSSPSVVEIDSIPL